MDGPPNRERSEWFDATICMGRSGVPMQILEYAGNGQDGHFQRINSPNFVLNSDAMMQNSG